MYNWTSEDIKTVETFTEARKRGLFVRGEEVTEVYNRVLNANLKSTNCQTCIRTRVMTLETELAKFKEQLAKEEEKSKELETPSTTETKITAKRVGRPPKNS